MHYDMFATEAVLAINVNNIQPWRFPIPSSESKGIVCCSVEYIDKAVALEINKSEWFKRTSAFFKYYYM